MTFCPVCKNDGKTCDACKAVSYLDGITAFLFYKEEGSIGKLIKNFKYNYSSDIAKVWQEVLEKILWIPEKNAVDIIPVPLYKRRERERGYNQSEIIASILNNVLKLSKVDCALNSKNLARWRRTEQQAKLNLLERQKNVSGAFEWQSAMPPKANIVLVDDVFTTGSTMQECAKVLKKAGAAWVWGLTLARGL